MKLSPALLAAVSAAPEGKGFVGPSSLFDGEKSPWPIASCKKSQACWSSNIKKKPGWENSDVKFLMCDPVIAKCVCKTGYMDANDDPYDGCEKRISDEAMCPYGKG